MLALKERASIKLKILTTLLGEVETKSKRAGEMMSDAMVIQTCKKFIASNKEVIKLKGGDDVCETENTILSSFLPSQLSEDEMRNIIATCGAIDIGEAMKYLKTNYAGQYDGKRASAIVREIL